MKVNWNIWIVLLLAGIGLSSCDDGETYAEQREKEQDAIQAFINRDVAICNSEGDTLIRVGKINVISESQFYAQDSLTNLANNEYVQFDNTGVYMQIVRKGAGDKLKHGQTKRLICHYTEFNILRDSIQTTNNVTYWQTNPDIMEVTNNYGTFTASFNTSINGGGAMYSYYGSKAVPAGWLVPLTYINIGRQITEDEEISKVRLIVPHTQGHSDASSNVYPCFYEITYQEMIY
ncbi:MAG TPA: DUF4827 domain-containing protein [Candidatus Paraprevotella stercorigallinarum]|jgi:hypothetical protein|nr:DUF4827 domain-containing protein [Candidatus Paraprevotella stercorigallinarum]